MSIESRTTGTEPTPEKEIVSLDRSRLPGCSFFIEQQLKIHDLNTNKVITVEPGAHMSIPRAGGFQDGGQIFGIVIYDQSQINHFNSTRVKESDLPATILVSKLEKAGHWTSF